MTLVIKKCWQQYSTKITKKKPKEVEEKRTGLVIVSMVMNLNK